MSRCGRYERSTVLDAQFISILWSSHFVMLHDARHDATTAILLNFGFRLPSAQSTYEACRCPTKECWLRRGKGSFLDRAWLPSSRKRGVLAVMSCAALWKIVTGYFERLTRSSGQGVVLNFGVDEEEAEASRCCLAIVSCGRDLMSSSRYGNRTRVRELERKGGVFPNRRHRASDRT